jgi:hypothetical protein
VLIYGATNAMTYNYSNSGQQRQVVV